jgi:phage shock protein E
MTNSAIRALLAPLMVLILSAAAPAVLALGSPDLAATRIDDGALIIDVRSAEEVEETGLLADATQVPHTDTAGLIETIGPDRDRPVVVYCSTGLRSSFAIDDLERAGYTDVVNGGSYEDLQQALAAQR